MIMAQSGPGVCDPASVARAAAKKSSELCKGTLGRAPAVIVQEEGTVVTFPFWTAALSYALTEVLKNACEATTKRSTSSPTCRSALPPVVCRVLSTAKCVKITVNDEGGGIPVERMRQIWGFANSGHGSMGSTKEQCALSGFGCGLPLSRQYLRYLGGDLIVESVEGKGTTVQMTIDHDSCRREVLHSVSTPVESSVQRLADNVSAIEQRLFHVSC